jgi:hypothetical protein
VTEHRTSAEIHVFELFKIKDQVYIGIVSQKAWWPFTADEARQMGAMLMQLAAEVKNDPINHAVSFAPAPPQRADRDVFRLFNLGGQVHIHIESKKRRWSLTADEAHQMGAMLMQLAAEAQDDPTDQAVKYW